MKDETYLSAERERLPYARSFRGLIVWQRARELQRAVFEASKKFPREEAYSLRDQLRRAARSIGAQIAEAWGKRAYERSFLSKLTDADAEQMETQHWIIVAVDDGYLASADARPLFDLCLQIGRLLCRMKERSDAFCQDSVSTVVREDPPELFAQEEPITF